LPQFAVRRLEDLPTVPDADVGWYPLQHHFGMSAFGANIFFAAAAGDELIAEHDETASVQEELYLVLRGSVRFALDGEQHDVEAVSVVAVPEPGVRRAAVALDDNAMLLALGAPPGAYHSTWRPAWFERVPKLR
jgi:quercetin dioxygenase-like cupin family protein